MNGRAIAFLRHGRTAWNDEGRLQGRRDVPVLPDALAALAKRRLPAHPALAGAHWCASPLRRAVETAMALSGRAPEPVAALIEMDWGDWEGHRLADLRAADPAGMATCEAAGLDLTPPGGESPRMVAARLANWLCAVADGAEPLVAVTHKGVIRAALVLAAGWDMTGKPPLRLDWTAAHLFRLGACGRLSLSEPNLPLEERS